MLRQGYLGIIQLSRSLTPIAPTPAIFVQLWRTTLSPLNRSDLRFPAATSSHSTIPHCSISDPCQPFVRYLDVLMLMEHGVLLRETPSRHHHQTSSCEELLVVDIAQQAGRQTFHRQPTTHQKHARCMSWHLLSTTTPRAALVIMWEPTFFPRYAPKEE